MTSSESRELRDLNRALLERLDRARFETEFWKLACEEYHERVEEIVHLLNNAPREGSAMDYLEGTRYIKISDTLANALVARLSGGDDDD